MLVRKRPVPSHYVKKNDRSGWETLRRSFFLAFLNTAPLPPFGAAAALILLGDFVFLEAGFTTPDSEEASVKAAALHRAREAWFLVDDSKFAQVYPAVIADLHSGAILTNRCPNPKYRNLTLVKETEV